MYKVVIIDDDAINRETLRIYLDSMFDDIVIVAEANNVKTGLEALGKFKPDLVFLDIQMPDGTGLDLLKKLNNIEFSLIFVSAYNEFAVEAFKYSAIDFVLKPIDPIVLKRAVDRFKSQNDQSNLHSRIMNLLNNQKAIEKIALPCLDGYFFVRINDIIRCESEGSYTKFFFVSGGNVLVSRPLKEYDEILSSQGFFRVHQSNLINLKYIKQYRKGDGGLAIMEDNTEVEVSRRKKEDFIKAMKAIKA